MLWRASGVWRVRRRVASAGRYQLAVRRSYADDGVLSNANLSSQQFPGRKALLGTVLTDDAQKTSIDDLVDHIPLQRVPDQEDTKKGPALLALLLTPSYGSHALTADLALKLLRRFHGENGSSLGKSLDVIAAVVDRVPSPKNMRAGHEGLAYMFQRNPSPLSVASQTPLRPSAQKPGSISFELPPNTRDSSEHLNLRSSSFTIQLPLAQTIFSTGIVSTLLHSHLIPEDENLSLQSQRHLETQTLRLPLIAGHRVLTSSMPLTPLTPFRMIRNHMGNIVRSLSSATALEEVGRWAKGETQSSPTQTASQELEAAVTSYFQSKDISPEPVNVWALVGPDIFKKIPGEDRKLQVRMQSLTAEQISMIWRGEDPAWADTIRHYVLRAFHDRGARLIKVLSGGGGWGKKAGLLSLDPDSIYSSRELRAERGWEFDFDGKNENDEDAVSKQKKQALGQVVNEGECIMFFLGPMEAKDSHDARMGQFLGDADAAVCFGALPSSIDAAPTPAVSSEGDADGTRVTFEPGLFGALSEGGMALTATPPGKAATSQSKFDVPYCYVSVTEKDEHGNIRAEKAALSKARKEKHKRRSEATRAKVRAKKAAALGARDEEHKQNGDTADDGQETLPGGIGKVRKIPTNDPEENLALTDSMRPHFKRLRLSQGDK